MNNLNQIIVEGTVTESSGIKTTVTGSIRTSLTLETKRTYRKADGSTAEEISSFELYAYGRLAEAIAETKGKMLRVVGRLKTETWTDLESQRKCSKIVIIAEHVVVMK